MSDIKSFEDLNCWKMGNKLRNEIKVFIKTLPEFEKYELVSQMRRTSRSVTHNIAEGYGRFHYKENVRFCRMARGSLYELLDQFNVASDEEYIEEKKHQEYRKQIFNCLAVLNGYINYLERAIKNK